MLDADNQDENSTYKAINLESLAQTEARGHANKIGDLFYTFFCLLPKSFIGLHAVVEQKVDFKNFSKKISRL